MKSFPFLLGSLASVSNVKSEPQQVDGPEMQKAMSIIKQVCGRDVSFLCPDPGSKLSTFETPHDPIMDLMMNPSARPPPMVDVTFILDTMINQALSVSSNEPAPVVRFFYLTEDPSEDEKVKVPEKVLDSMVQTLVEKTNEEPEAVVDKIVQHGNDLLKTKHDTDFLRMARRLSELDTGKIVKPRLPLPFGCSRNRCLMHAYEEDLVSSACARALRTAEETHTTTVQRAAKIEEESQVFIGVGILYVFFVIMTAFLLHKKFRAAGKKIRTKLRTTHLIMQAVYSDPEIKSKVEKSVGENIGFVPPLPDRMQGRSRNRMGNTACFFAVKMLKLTTISLFLTLIFIDPLHAMFVLCISVILRFIHLSCFPAPEVDDDCTCCCCALSAKDAQRGYMKKNQACCTCCNGTGVCSPGCAACCTGDDPCDCCSEGCNCCDPPAPTCQCCCCGATDVDGLNGTLTGDQACCTCCKGTGKCAAGCAACCGDDPCNCCHGDCDCCDPPAPTCQCCCCGATDIDMLMGTLTEGQVCCTCCKGTGKCSVGCAACCDNGDDPCDCCHGDCDCCDSDSKAKIAVYEGIPIKIV